MKTQQNNEIEVFFPSNYSINNGYAWIMSRFQVLPSGVIINEGSRGLIFKLPKINPNANITPAFPKGRWS